MKVNNVFLVFVGLLSVSAAIDQQKSALYCEHGACCDIFLNQIREKGAPCTASKHPCFEASGTCDGVSSKCTRVFKPDESPCGIGGKCYSGVCHTRGRPSEIPAKGYTETALRTHGLDPSILTAAITSAPAQQPAHEEPKKEEEEEVEIQDPIIVHEYEDSILETLRHLPELAKMRQKKHEIEEKKLKAFRKLTHLVIRKHSEQLEREQLFYRRSKVRLQDEMQDMNNLHRHLHLHHKQNHGLDKTATEELEEMGQAVLQAVAGNSTSTTNGTKGGIHMGYVVGICALAVVAVVLVVVIIASIVKASSAKPAKKDYY